MSIKYFLLLFIVALLFPHNTAEEIVKRDFRFEAPMCLPYTLSLKVDVTMYHPVEGQTDDTPDIVADGTRFKIHKASDYKWIAVSRDLHTRYGGQLSFGDKVILYIPRNPEKSGTYIVKDLMNKRFTNKIDILENIGTPLYSYDEVDMYKPL